MRPSWTNLLALFLGVAFAAIVFFGPMKRWANAEDFIPKARAQLLQSEASALEALGPPDVTYDEAGYEKTRPLIDESYNPSPPSVECQKVLEYGRGARLILLFVDHGRVEQIYVGAT